jgi:hypothetical protein
VIYKYNFIKGFRNELCTVIKTPQYGIDFSRKKTIVVLKKKPEIEAYSIGPFYVKQDFKNVERFRTNAAPMQ